MMKREIVRETINSCLVIPTLFTGVPLLALTALIKLDTGGITHFPSLLMAAGFFWLSLSLVGALAVGAGYSWQRYLDWKRPSSPRGL